MRFDEIKALIDQHGYLADFEGGVSESEIRSCEERLGVKLPTSYVEFLRTYGVGSFGGHEIFGLGIPATGVPSMLWYTEVTRRDEPGFPKSYVAIYDAGLGEILCLATDQMTLTGECPVISWVTGSTEQPHEVVAATFVHLLGDLVISQIARNK